MAIEFTQHPAGIIQPGAATSTGDMSMKSPRLRKTEAAKLKLAHISLQGEHYTGPKKFKPPAYPEVQQSDTGSQLLSISLTMAQSKDASYFSQLHSENPVEWSGFNDINDRTQVGMHRPICGPLIDSPPAHPDTFLTTMAYLDRTLKSLGMLHVHLTLQLCIIAC